MTTTAAPTHAGAFDAAALRSAIAGRDAEALLALYATDATIELADADHPPSAPRTLHGHAEIGPYLRAIYARDMTHAVDVVAATPDALGYSVRCTYPGGGRVLCSGVAELRDGRIAREVALQAWDD
jgi:ketosteroid isomerase-like protein